MASKTSPATKQVASSQKETETKPKNTRTKAREIILSDTVTVKYLSDKLGVSPIEVIKQLMRSGVMAGINQVIGFDVAELITPAFGYKAKKESATSEHMSASKPIEPEQDEFLATRSPIVTIMGHVDHGKTTLLDAIRKTHVAEKEFGGITQNISAYQVTYNNQEITFLDTPGHAAFTAIRSRGAKVTDIAVLVVAADDGVMPQTIEAIDHAKAADVPIIVAINKIDRQEADSDRVKRELADQNLLLEEWGGDVIGVEVSATQQLGLENLLENILVVAEVADLKADAQKAASGVIIEARLDKNKGSLATTLIKNGSLHVGDYIVAGRIWGKVKAMTNYLGQKIQEAGPSSPVEIMGLGKLPSAGDILTATSSDKAARQLAEQFISETETAASTSRAITLAGIHINVSSGETKELNLVIKTDVQGSADAITMTLGNIDSSDIDLRILHIGSGAITESDVLLASASNAIVLGFNSITEPGAQRLSDREQVEIRHYRIIYHLLEDVEKALKGLLEPKYEEIQEGTAEIREVFDAGKRAKVAGCMVTSGQLSRNISFRLTRGKNIVFEGSISSLRRFKQAVNHVESGYECGVAIDGFNDYQVGDIIQTYSKQLTPQ